MNVVPHSTMNTNGVPVGFSWVQLALKFTLQSKFFVSPFVFIVLRGTTFICTLTFSSPQFTTKSSPTFSV